MGIDRLDQTGNILRRSGTGDIDGKGHVLEAGRDVRDSEEPAQIHPALSGHINAVERDAKHPGIRGIDDLLARAQGGEDQFYRSGSRVGATDQRRFIHVDLELSDAYLRTVFVDERRGRGECHHGRFRRIAEICPHLFDHRAKPIDLLLCYHGRTSRSDAGSKVIPATPPLTGGRILELSIKKYNTSLGTIGDVCCLRWLEQQWLASGCGCCLSLWLAQDVADAAHRLDETGFAALFQRLAHRGDGHRQDVRFTAELSTPDPLHDRVV
jgi:hypothetical protein